MNNSARVRLARRWSPITLWLTIALSLVTPVVGHTQTESAPQTGLLTQVPASRPEQGTQPAQAAPISETRWFFPYTIFVVNANYNSGGLLPGSVAVFAPPEGNPDKQDKLRSRSKLEGQRSNCTPDGVVSGNWIGLQQFSVLSFQ